MSDTTIPPIFRETFDDPAPPAPPEPVEDHDDDGRFGCVPLLVVLPHGVTAQGSRGFALLGWIGLASVVTLDVVLGRVADWLLWQRFPATLHTGLVIGALTTGLVLSAGLSAFGLVFVKARAWTRLLWLLALVAATVCLGAGLNLWWL